MSCDEYAKIILPHVGLVLLCVLYTLAGATLFYLVEKPNELHVRQTSVSKIKALKATILNEMWNLSQSDNSSESDFRETAEDHLNSLTKTLFDAFEDRYITVESIHGNSTHRSFWTFPASVFFAATTITTIGYGNLVPVTTQGRILCVFFGLFGVPLMLVTIADMGKFISDGLVWCYRKYRKLKARLKLMRLGRKNAQANAAPATGHQLREEMRQKDLLELAVEGDEDEEEELAIPVSLILLIIVGYTTLGGVLLRMWEDWPFFDSFYFSFITMTTVGFGDIYPAKESYYFLTLLYIVLGLAITTMCVDLVGSQYIQKIHYFGRKIRKARDALKTMGEVMKYAAFLRKKYGLTDEQLRKMSILPDVAEWQDYIHHCSAYVPKDIHRIYYIDQSLVNSVRDSIRTNTLREGSNKVVDDNSLASRTYV